MVVETAIAEVRGIDLGNLRERLGRILRTAGLPVEPPGFDLDRIWSLMHSDKKAIGGEIRMVLPDCLGTVSIQGGISFESFREAWWACRV
jgi:3-dehydroquinate synthetase